MSCLFNSLSFFLNETSYIIRQKICDYLMRNGKIIEGLDTNFILNLEGNNYIQNMRNTSTWGGAIEIQCACNIWNARIVVRDIRNCNRNNRNINNNNKIEFLPLHAITSIHSTLIKLDFELEWSGGHYEPCRN